MTPMWKKLMQQVDLDEPNSFLDHEYLGCTQRECKPKTEKCSNHEFLLEQLKNYQGGESLTQKRLRCPARWNDMLTTCVERYCELANKKTAIVQSFKPLLK